MTYPEKKPNNKKRMNTAIIAAIVVVVLLILFFTFSPYVVVPPGHTGVVVTMGRVSDNVLSDGLNFKLPWQNVVLMDNRAQKVSLTTQAFSSDIQQVDVNISVNYSIDRETSQDLYKNVGTEYYNTVMLPRIMENVKAVFSKYTAENLVVARETLSSQVKDLLTPEMKAYGIEVISIAIEDVDFTEAFTDAVEAKQVAEQTKLKTEIEQAEKLMIAETAAKTLKIDAEAKAEAQLVAARAEAEANTLVAESITPDLISYVQANNWDGALPKFMTDGSGSIMPILNMEPE